MSRRCQQTNKLQYLVKPNLLFGFELRNFLRKAFEGAVADVRGLLRIPFVQTRVHVVDRFCKIHSENAAQRMDLVHIL